MTLFLGVYLAARVVILARGKVFTSYDTFSYAYRGDPFFDRGPLVDFLGHAPRLWGVPLFYSFFPDDRARVVAQWSLGTVAWALLAWSVMRLMRTAWGRLAGFGLVLLIGLVYYVVNWDFAILSESLSLTLGAFTLAFFLWWRRTRSVWPLVGMNLSGLWWVFVRPDIRVLVVVLVVALAVLAWRAGGSSRQRWQALASVLVMLAGTVWCTLISSNVEREFQRYSATGLSHDRELLVYRIRLHVLSDPAVKSTFQDKLGMPNCPAANEIAKRTEWAAEEFAVAYANCPDLVAWGERNGDDMWQQFAIAAPGQFTKLIWQLTNDSFAGSGYAQTPSVLPAPVERAAFPSRAQGLPYALAVFALALMLCGFAGGFTRSRLAAWTGVVTGGACLLGGVAGSLLGAGEYWRFGIQETIGIRVAAVLIAVAALDVWLSRRGLPDRVASVTNIEMEKSDERRHQAA